MSPSFLKNLPRVFLPSMVSTIGVTNLRQKEVRIMMAPLTNQESRIQNSLILTFRTFLFFICVWEAGLLVM